MEDKFVKSNPFEKTENREGVKPKRKEPTPPVEPIKPSEPIQEEPKPEKLVVEKPEQATNLLAELTNKKPTGKGYNVYLDADVIEKLDKLAKQAKTSRSKVINTLLRNLLLDQ